MHKTLGEWVPLIPTAFRKSTSVSQTVPVSAMASDCGVYVAGGWMRKEFSDLRRGPVMRPAVGHLQREVDPVCLLLPCSCVGWNQTTYGKHGLGRLPIQTADVVCLRRRETCWPVLGFQSFRKATLGVSSHSFSPLEATFRMGFVLSSWLRLLLWPRA